jgi:hypothetical protein
MGDADNDIGTPESPHDKARRDIRECGLVLESRSDPADRVRFGVSPAALVAAMTAVNAAESQAQ